MNDLTEARVVCVSAGDGLPECSIVVCGACPNEGETFLDGLVFEGESSSTVRYGASRCADFCNAFDGCTDDCPVQDLCTFTSAEYSVQWTEPELRVQVRNYSVTELPEDAPVCNHLAAPKYRSAMSCVSTESLVLRRVAGLWD